MTDQAIAEDGVEAPEQEAAEAPSRFGKKKLLIIAGGAVVLFAVIGAGLYFSGLLNRFIGGEKPVAGEAAKEEKKVKKETVYFDLPDMLVNLNGVGKKSSFLKLSIALELENPLDVSRLQSVMPRIIDNFQVYLRELRPEDLRGAPGMYRLREELLLRVNAAAAPAKVVDVLFKEMLVQ